MAEQDSFDPIRDEVERVVRRGLDRIVGRVKERLSTPYPPSSRPGDHPHRRTGRLMNSIEGRITQEAGGFRVDVVSDVPYATYLEASGRPVVGDAADELAAEIDAEIDRL